jgi:cytochrome d ubiquinol oxidase subunit I
LLTGHHAAEGVAHNQPAKLAALEGHYAESGPADLYLFGWVNQKTGKVYGLKIPGGLSFLIHQDFEASVPGLESFVEDQRPTAINAIFQFYHLMVGIGMILIALSLLGVWFWIRGSLFEQRWLLWLFVFSVVLPQVANQVGWYAAEMGRQPWVVYGLLRTSDALSEAVTAEQVLFSLIMFTLLYALLLALFLYLLNKKIVHGPYDEDADQDEDLERPFHEQSGAWLARAKGQASGST